jgi:hypothetical protein
MAISVTAPAITSITISPSGTITPGTAITATVAYTPGTSQGGSATQTLTGVVTDTTTGQTGQLTQTFTISGSVVTDPTVVTVSDTGNHTWAKTSDNGSTAIFTTTA